jgi:hypothetical protein
VAAEQVGELPGPDSARVRARPGCQTPRGEVLQPIDERTKLDRLRLDHRLTLAAPAGGSDLIFASADGTQRCNERRQARDRLRTF